MLKENRKFIFQTFVIWIVEVLVLGGLSYFYGGLEVLSFWQTLLFVVILGLLNALIWPTLIRLTFPLTLITLGFFSLFLNALMVIFASYFTAGVEIKSLWAGVVVAATLTITNSIISGLFSLNEDHSFQRNVALKRSKQITDEIETDEPGYIFLEIDGLSERTLRNAISRGSMPHIKKWLVEEGYRIEGWECDLSSQTGASQAGLLLGNNGNMPAFRWYEKDKGKSMVTNNLPDAETLEVRQSSGKGLLSDNGASRGNIFSGDAPNVMFTMSKIRDKSKFQSNDFYLYFSQPYNFLRTIFAFLGDVAVEKKAAWTQSLRHEEPRIKRGGIYALMRGVMVVVFRDIQIHSVLGDMYRGVPSVYSTFAGYDEVAHHSGVERSDAMDVLRGIDKQFGRLREASKFAPRPYKFVVLSDHGQSQGATFLQRYGETLEDLVQRIASEKVKVKSIVGSDEAWTHINSALSQVIQDEKSITSKLVKKAVGKHSEDGNVELGDTKHRKEDPINTEGKEENEDVDLVVMASGNLGLIYFTAWDKRLTLEEIGSKFPGLVKELSQHPGIGFLLIQTDDDGSVAVGKDGIYYLDKDTFEGKNPLKDFGPNIVTHLKRTSSFKNTPDILVNSLYDPNLEEVAAFEELVGSHGGAGGPQSHPFILFPGDLDYPEEPVVGAEQLHKVLKAWVSGV
jgi:putative membrane protein